MYKDPLEKYKYAERLELKDVEMPNAVSKTICCPSCSSEIPAEDLNIHSHIGKCTNCNKIFSFSEEVDNLVHKDVVSQEILKPEGIEIWQYQDELDVSVEQPWSIGEILALTFFPGFVFALLGIVIENVTPTALTRAALIAFLIMSFVAYIAYFFIRKRHRVYIHIDEHDLYVERRPRKFVKDKRYAIDEIDQVYIKNVKSSSNGANTIGLYMIVNGLDGQKHVTLINSIKSRSKAKFLEQEIEKHLNIKDRRVPEENA